jgi:hypothetical protein
LNTINYIDSRNSENILRYPKHSFNNNIKDIILKDKINNESIQKLCLPNLNIGIKENRRNLSSVKKNNNIDTDEIWTKNLKKYSSYSKNRHDILKENNENYDNIKINCLSTLSKSSNILIPIVSIENIINENNYGNNNKNINNKFNKLDIRIEKENSKNNTNEIIKNKKICSYNKNKLLKKIHKKLLLENNSFNYNLLINNDSNSFMSKLHKIKIEKGVMDNKILENFNKNLLNQQYYFLKTSENNIINSKLPIINKH